MNLDELLDDAAKNVNDHKHHALLIFPSPAVATRIAVQATKKYAALGGKLHFSDRRWEFPSGASVRFRAWDNGDAEFPSWQQPNWVGVDRPELFSQEAKNVLSKWSTRNGDLDAETFSTPNEAHVNVRRRRPAF